MKSFAVALMVVLLGSASVAQAQGNGRGSQWRSGVTAYGVPGHHYGFGHAVAGGVHHASTAYESGCRGVAAMIQAQGQYNLLSSLAMMNVAQAQRMQMENYQQRLESQAAMRQAYQERRAEELAARRGNSRAAVAAADAQSAPAIGLSWPAAMQGTEYAGYRRLAERVLARQATGAEVPAADVARLREAHRSALRRLGASDSPEAGEAVQFVQNLRTARPSSGILLAAQ